MLGVIPARGGSKRIPGKNIKPFLGKPLLAWTIEVARQSKAFERLILLTDNEAIAEMGKSLGAEVPFMEPAELARDTAYIGDALRWMLGRLAEEGYLPQDFILLEPSCVGRNVTHIRDVAKIMEERTDFDSIIGVSEVPAHFSHLKQLNVDDKGIVGRVGDGAPLKNLTHRNQDVAKSYYINSAIYGFRRKNLFEGDKKLWGESTYGYVMDGNGIVDIDTQDEWDLAEFKIK